MADERQRLVINGVVVEFPFKPYQSQVQMMDKIIKTLNKDGGCALLESPTGTGKTLAVLCSALAWARMSLGQKCAHKKTKRNASQSLDCEEPVCEVEGPSHESTESDEDEQSRPRIYFATRTHRQIKQIVSELKMSGNGVEAAVLGGKKHLCINTKINKKSTLDEECSELIKKGNCEYFKKKGEVLKHVGNIYDIEEIYKAGKKCKGCAYYAAKEAAGNADIVFLPYNYIVDETIRQSMDIRLKNAIVIFDEAHNIEDSCREAGSFSTTTKEIGIVHQELSGFRNGLKDEDDGSNGDAHAFEDVLFFLRALVKLVSSKINTSSEESVCMVRDDVAMFIEENKVEAVVPALEKTRDLLLALQKDGADDGDTKKKPSLATRRYLDSLSATLSRLLSWDGRIKGSTAFSFVFSKGIERVGQKSEKTLRIKFCCLLPSFIFRSIAAESRNVILTSGTLSPMETFSSELGVVFCETLEAPHVIEQKQIATYIVPFGPTGAILNGVFQNASTDKYQTEIAQSIEAVVQAVPFGVLCFFPSYASMDRIIAKMKGSEVYERIAQRKEIVLEPRDSNTKAFNRELNRYYLAIASARAFYTQHKRHATKNGALLFAVYRGKVSEGLDFVDDNARCVVCIGIPYPNYKDLEVRNKQDFNNEYAARLKLCRGYTWYEAQAYKALNQALGRCIRHSLDWGAVILLESRFKDKNIKVSKWAAKAIERMPHFNAVAKGLAGFVARNMAEMKPRPQKKLMLDAESDSEHEDENTARNKPTRFTRPSKPHFFQ
eukprot:GHVN01100649.1.p2 GENE.GHVN01100649.1~~GHVN01100649.1.p2  ORF type:complete len:776 (+),score=64.22 GHVN01100649.1:3223-5550(+)